MQFDVETVNRILDIDDSYKAPEKLMEIMMNKDKREATFKQFLAISDDLSFDWFHEYFEDEQAQRKSKKQDFTPNSVAKILSLLSPATGNYFEAAAGTGGIMITSWSIKPARYYEVEEMSDRALPFLLFNMAVRRMHGVAIQCDSLERKAKDVYLLDDGNINKLDHSKEVANKYDIREWVTKF